MDHDAVREQMELAAVEPDGLERLMAGDTPTAQAVAGHLAGCPGMHGGARRACSARPSSFVTRSGRCRRPTSRPGRWPRSVPKGSCGRCQSPPRARPWPVRPSLPRPSPTPSPLPAPVSLDRRRRLMPVLGWVATIAAAVVLSVVAASYLVGSRVDDQLAAQSVAIKGLQEITTATLTVTAQPDAEHVALAGVSDPELYGGLTYSPSTSELVVVASGLTPPAAGLEYRCWVEVDGKREKVGKMFFNQDLAFWVGPSPAITGLSTGATFGVSLVDAAGSAVDTDPVLLGEL